MAARIGSDASLPLLGTWKDITSFERDWGSLPDAFMLKPTHGSSWYRAVPCKAGAGRSAIFDEATTWLRRNDACENHRCSRRLLTSRKTRSTSAQ